MSAVTGRPEDYDEAAIVADVRLLATFFVWADDADARFGGHDAIEAFSAMCRLLNFDEARLRAAVLS